MGGGWSGETANRYRSVPSPVSFNINPNNTFPGASSDRQQTRAQQPEGQTSLGRSNTFVIETNQEEMSRPTRSVDITEFYNVQRRPRAKTPMTFNVMFDEPAVNIDFEPRTVDESGNNGAANIFWPTPAQSKINYSAKKKPKLTIGKPGREYGEFIWPLDVAVNSFNNQILVSDSNNHRIQVFEPDGRFVRSFGRQGNREGQFDCINGIFVDSMSNIFVVDRLNHRKKDLLKLDGK